MKTPVAEETRRSTARLALCVERASRSRNGPIVWNVFPRTKWWKLIGLAFVVAVTSAGVRGETTANCAPIVTAPTAVTTVVSNDDAVAWWPPRKVFLVANGLTLSESSGVGHTSKRLATLPRRAVSVSTSRTSDLVAVVTPGATPAVIVYAPTRTGLRALGGGVEASRSPSRVSLGDVDGDGRIEALVLVTGRARFDPRLALRPFVYGWDGRRLYPKWLGSRLSRPFDDATLGDLDGDGRDELVAVERTRDGALELAAYRWRGFGFERVATSDSLARVCGPSVDASGHILARVDDAITAFLLKDGRLDRLPIRSD